MKMKKEKRNYIPPQVELIVLEMECGIAAGSAVTRPDNSSGEVKHEWVVGEDIQQDLPW